MIYLNLLVAIIPVVFVGLYIYNQDKEKEPTSFLIKLIFCGILSSFTVLIISYIFKDFFISNTKNILEMNIKDLIIYSFIEVALIEEFSKFLYLYIFSYNSKEYDHSFDMIVYGSFVSLGFALIENIIYVFCYGITIGIGRAVTAIMLHACCGVLMGLLLGKAKEKELINKSSFMYKLFAVVVPIIIHGMYDFCAFTGSFIYLITILIILVTLSVTFINIKSSKDRVLIYRSEE